MSTVSLPGRMTTEDFLALPEDGVDRDLIRGELREYAMTRRGRRHTRAAAKLVVVLSLWLETQPHPRGEILVGEAGFRIRRNPDTTVGIDVAYVGPEASAQTPDDVFVYDDLPVLAAEILSPSDTQAKILDKVEEYLEAGVPLVWILEPVFKTVTVYQPGRGPILFNSPDELTGDPHLPGFRARVAELF
jgi:Uma2 family endonuclease